MIVLGVLKLVTFGADPEKLLDTKNILLKDVINVRVKNITFNELVHNLMISFFLTLIATSLVTSKLFAYIFISLSLFQILFITIKFKFLNADILKNRTKLITFLLLLLTVISSAVLICFTYLFDMRTPGMLYWIAFGGGMNSLGSIVTAIRFNLDINDTATILELTSRRGDHSIALKHDDIKEARQLIWKARKDILKIDYTLPDNTL